MSKTIVVPEWFKVGIKFNSKHICGGDNTCTLVSFDIDKNKAEVDVVSTNTKFTDYNWNVKHLIWGFELGEYKLIE